MVQISQKTSLMASPLASARPLRQLWRRSALVSLFFVAWSQKTWAQTPALSPEDTAETPAAEAETPAAEAETPAAAETEVDFSQSDSQPQTDASGDLEAAAATEPELESELGPEIEPELEPEIEPELEPTREYADTYYAHDVDVSQDEVATDKNALSFLGGGTELSTPSLVALTGGGALAGLFLIAQNPFGSSSNGGSGSRTDASASGPQSGGMSNNGSGVAPTPGSSDLFLTDTVLQEDLVVQEGEALSISARSWFQSRTGEILDYHATLYTLATVDSQSDSPADSPDDQTPGEPPQADADMRLTEDDTGDATVAPPSQEALPLSETPDWFQWSDGVLTIEAEALDDAHVGTYVLVVEARTESGAYLTHSLDFVIESKPEAPHLARALPDRFFDRKSFFSLDLSDYFSDEDREDSLSFSAEGLPEGLQLTDNILAGAVTNPNAVGVHTITIEASDGQSSVQDAFLVTILPGEPLFRLADAAPFRLEAREGSTAHWDVASWFLYDGHALDRAFSFSATIVQGGVESAVPDWLVLAPQTDTLTVLEHTDDASVGVHIAFVTIHDVLDAMQSGAQSHFSLKPFVHTVTLELLNVNDAPFSLEGSPSNETLTTGETFAETLTVSDWFGDSDAGDQLRYTLDLQASNGSSVAWDSWLYLDGERGLLTTHEGPKDGRLEAEPYQLIVSAIDQSGAQATHNLTLSIDVAPSSGTLETQLASRNWFFTLDLETVFANEQVTGPLHFAVSESVVGNSNGLSENVVNVRLAQGGSIVTLSSNEAASFGAHETVTVTLTEKTPGPRGTDAAEPVRQKEISFLVTSDANHLEINPEQGLNPELGFQISGPQSGRVLVKSVLSQDFNGDGLADLLVAGPGVTSGVTTQEAGETNTPATTPGEAIYLVYGMTEFSQTLNLRTAEHVFNFHQDMHVSVDQAVHLGNFDGDAFQDLLIRGSTEVDSQNNRVAETFYLVSGAPGDSGDSGTAADSVLQTSSRLVLQKTSSGSTGFSWAAPAGDVNQDGLDDILIGDFSAANGAGRAYVLYGKAGGLPDTQSGTQSGASHLIDVENLAAGEGFVVETSRSSSWLGASGEGVGDVNGDGIGDLLVGASGSDRAYVIYGKAGTARQTVDVDHLSQEDGFTIRGDSSNFLLGLSAEGAGDINGDGLADLLIGNSGGQPVSGGVYVVFGQDTQTDFGLSVARNAAGETIAIDGMAVLPAPGDSTIALTQRVLDVSLLAATEGFEVRGEPGTERTGLALNSAGDFNGDGLGDILIGAPGSSNTATTEKAYLLYGKSEGTSGAFGPEFGTGSLFLASYLTDAQVTLADGTLLEVGATLTADAQFQNSVTLAPQESVLKQGDTVLASVDTRAVLELDNLGPEEGFSLSSRLADTQFGAHVASAGDLNGDGFDDIAVSGSSGQAYVLYGGAHYGPNVIHAQNLEAKAGQTSLIGKAGDDTLSENADGAVEAFYGGAGSDYFRLTNHAFTRIDGGSGQDTVELAPGQALSGIAHRLHSIETLSLSDAEAFGEATAPGTEAEATRVTLDLSTVRSITDPHARGGADGELLLTLVGSGVLELEEGVAADTPNTWELEGTPGDGRPDAYRLENALVLVDEGILVV